MIDITVLQGAVPVTHRFSRTQLAKLAQALAELVPGADQGSVDVSFISDNEIRRLNRMYRGKDKVTEVLSFNAPNPELTGQLGDVLISYDQAVRQAEGDDIELELADLLVHGILHLLGYDHERAEDADRMFPLQDKLVDAIL